MPCESRKIFKVTILNRFDVLKEIVEEEHETRLISDLIIRGQLTEYCGRDPFEKRRHMCLPAIGVDGTTAAHDDVMTG